jgi:hypothetical protein
VNVVLFTVDERLLNNPCIFQLCEAQPGAIRGVVDCEGFHSRRRSILTAMILGATGLGRLLWKRLSKRSRSLADYCAEKRLPYLRASDINSPEVLEFCARLEVDVIVSLVLAQRVKRELLSRYPAINVHFADLPHYRGIFPVFWALSQGAQRVGISVHEIIAEFDKGRVIARAYSDTTTRDFLGTMEACFERTPALVAKALTFYDPEQREGYQLPSVPEAEGSYHSLPTVRDVLNYHFGDRAIAEPQ